MSAILGGAGNYSEGQSASHTTSIPKWAEPYFKGLGPIASEYEALFNPTGGAPTAAATDEIMRSLSGQMENPATNPELQDVLNSLNTQSQQNWQNVIVPSITSQAEGVGDLYSTQAAKALGQAGVQEQQNYQQQVANLLYGNYGTERQNQIDAVAQALGLNTDQLNKLLSVLDGFKGIEQQTSGETSGWGVGGNAGTAMGGGGK